MHKIKTKMGLIYKAKGSSFFECNNTVVICTVDINNKHEQLKNEEYNKAIVEIKYRNIYQSLYESYYGKILKKITEKSILNIDMCKSISINIIVDSSSMNTLWCSINALFLGLVDAGIPLNNILYANTNFSNNEDVFVYDTEGKLVWYHAFCDLNHPVKQDNYKYYEYVKEIVSFACKNNLIKHF